MEKNGNFLETGSYNGHYYGTPKPLLGDLITKDDTTDVSTENGDLELDQRTLNNTESNERVIVHSESGNLNLKGLESGKKEEGLQNQPINV
jgi:hypothetical protein